MTANTRARDQAAVRGCGDGPRRHSRRRGALRFAAGACRKIACSILDDDQLRERRCVLRVRVESGRSLLTFKGPVQPSTAKLREELETVVGDGSLVVRVLEELGFRVWFRYQKYREEFALDDVLVALDETPVGTSSKSRAATAASPTPRKRSGADRAITCSTRIGGSIRLDCETRGIAGRATCCSRTDLTSARADRPDRRSRHPAPAVDRRSREARDTRGRRADDPADHSLAAARAASPISCSTCITVLRPSPPWSAMAATSARASAIRGSSRPSSAAGGGPRLALPLIDADPFFIINGDTLTDVDLAALAEAHARVRRPGDAGARSQPCIRSVRWCRASTRTNRVTGFVPRGPSAEGSFHYIGVQLAHAVGVFRHSPRRPRRERLAASTTVLMIDRPGTVRGFVLDAAFWDVGTVADYWRTTRAFEQPRSLQRPPAPARIDPTAHVIGFDSLG